MSEPFWYYARGGQQIGPIPLAELRRRATVGELRPDDLVWCEGWPNWVAARDVDELAPPAPSARSSRPIDPPRREPVPAPARREPPAKPKAVYVPDDEDDEPAPVRKRPRRRRQRRTEYAGFWRRAVAFAIDFVIVGVVVNLIGFFLFRAMAASAVPEMQARSAVGTISGLLGWLYFALMESSDLQATIGKQFMGVVVTDLEGRPLGFHRATRRDCCRLRCCLGLGFQRLRDRRLLGQLVDDLLQIVGSDREVAAGLLQGRRRGARGKRPSPARLVGSTEGARRTCLRGFTSPARPTCRRRRFGDRALSRP